MELGIHHTRFTLDGEPTFLLGLSYYGGLGASDATVLADLAQAQQYGFNWIRVWATWAAFDYDVSAIDRDGGYSREPFSSRLLWLVAECDRRNMVVDVTLSRGNGATGPPRLQTAAAHTRAVEHLVTTLRGYRNWYLDLSNERDMPDQRYTSFKELASLRALVRRLDPDRLVTASHSGRGDITPDELREYLFTAQVDMLSPHPPRFAGTAQDTAAKTQTYLAWMADLGRQVPVHYQEPFRRGFDSWQPDVADFLIDLKGARQGGGAGWCLHNGHQHFAPDGRPRRSFDLRDGPLFEQFEPVEREVLANLLRWRGAQG